MGSTYGNLSVKNTSQEKYVKKKIESQRQAYLISRESADVPETHLRSCQVMRGKYCLTEWAALSF